MTFHITTSFVYKYRDDFELLIDRNDFLNQKILMLTVQLKIWSDKYLNYDDNNFYTLNVL